MRVDLSQRVGEKDLIASKIVCDCCGRAIIENNKHLTDAISYWSINVRRGRDFCLDCAFKICEQFSVKVEK